MCAFVCLVCGVCVCVCVCVCVFVVVCVCVVVVVCVCVCMCVCTGRVAVLIATDVASRGLDIKDVS